MSQEKLTIVPVTLHPENKSITSRASSIISPLSSCTIKIADAEVTFFNGVEEHIIQTIMRELKHW